MEAFSPKGAVYSGTATSTCLKALATLHPKMKGLKSDPLSAAFDAHASKVSRRACTHDMLNSGSTGDGMS